MKKLRLLRTVSAFLFLLLVTGCSGIYENGSELAADISPYVQQITVDELNNKIENMEEFFLIDVRQPVEFDVGNIPYSVLIPRGVIEFEIDNESFWEEAQWYLPKKDADIVIYCKKGDRGILATKALLELGYSNVKNLKGGILAWDPEFDEGGTPQKEEGGCGG